MRATPQPGTKAHPAKLVADAAGPVYARCEPDVRPTARVLVEDAF